MRENSLRTGVPARVLSGERLVSSGRVPVVAGQGQDLNPVAACATALVDGMTIEASLRPRCVGE